MGFLPVAVAMRSMMAAGARCCNRDSVPCFNLLLVMSPPGYHNTSSGSKAKGFNLKKERKIAIFL